MNFIFPSKIAPPPNDVINSKSRKLHANIVHDSFGHAETIGAILKTIGFFVAEIWVQICQKWVRCDVTLYRQREPDGNGTSGNERTQKGLSIDYTFSKCCRRRRRAYLGLL